MQISVLLGRIENSSALEDDIRGRGKHEDVVDWLKKYGGLYEEMGWSAVGAFTVKLNTLELNFNPSCACIFGYRNQAFDEEVTSHVFNFNGVKESIRIVS